jgi:hypothetical protein
MPAGSLRRRAASRTAPLTARAGVLALVTVNRRVRPWLSGNGISGEPVKRLLAKLGVKTDGGVRRFPMLLARPRPLLLIPVLGCGAAGIP